MTPAHELLAVAQELKAAGRLDRAAEVLERAALHFARTGQAKDACTAWSDAATAWQACGEFGRADNALVAGLPYATSVDEQIAIDASLVSLLANSGRVPLAIPIAARLLARLSQADLSLDAQKVIYALRSLAVVFYELEDSFSTMLAAGNALRDRVQGNLLLLGSIDGAQGHLFNVMACPLAAEAALRRAQTLLQEPTSRATLATACNNLALSALVRGDPAAAIEAFDQTEEVLNQAGAGEYFKFVVRGSRATAHAAAGGLQDALADVEGMLDLAPRNEPLSNYMRVRAAAVIAACGLREEALSWMRDQPQLADDSMVGARALWLMARLEQDPLVGRQLVARARALCPRGELHFRACQEAMEFRHGAVAVSQQALDDAIEAAEAKGMTGLVRHLSVTYASHVLEQGDTGGAVAHALRAVRLQDFLDFWMDELPSAWQAARPVFERCQRPDLLRSVNLKLDAHATLQAEVSQRARAVLERLRRA